MPLQQSQIDSIKSRLKAFSERYVRKLAQSISSLKNIDEQSWEKSWVSSEVATRTDDDTYFKALFAEELREKGSEGK